MTAWAVMLGGPHYGRRIEADPGEQWITFAAAPPEPLPACIPPDIFAPVAGMYEYRRTSQTTRDGARVYEYAGVTGSVNKTEFL